MVGGLEQSAGAKPMAFAHGNVDDLGIGGIYGQGLSAIVIQLLAAKPVGQGQPGLGGRLPTVKTTHIRADVNQIFLAGMEVNSSNGPTSANCHRFLSQGNV